MADSTPVLDEIFRYNQSFYAEDLSRSAKKRIRILGLNAGRFDDPIVCRLRTVPLVRDLAYGALSYSWGDKKNFHSITINGKDDFKVTGSVYGALKRLRHPSRVRCVWIDSLCVNQANPDERGDQVSLMADIFRYAELVWVYLGPSSKQVHDAQDPEACEQHLVLWDGDVLVQHSNTSSAVILNGDAMKDDKSQWWWRTWTVQEVSLARRVIVLVGPHQMSWEKALAAFEQGRFDIDNGEMALSRPAYRQMCQVNTVRAKHSWLCPHLRYLLHLTAAHATSDPRDKVYGVLGLLNDECRQSARLAPDYRRKWAEICMDTTMYLIESEDMLDILIEEWPRSIEGAPSWALDFSKGFRSPPSLLGRHEVSYLDPPDRLTNTLRCFASGTTRPSFAVDGCLLSINAIYFDQVTATVHQEPSQSKKICTFRVDPYFLVDVGVGTCSYEDSTVMLCTQDIPQHKLTWDFDVAKTEYERLAILALYCLELIAQAAYEQCSPSSQYEQPASLDVTENFARSVSADWYLRTEQSWLICPGDFEKHVSGFRIHKKTNLFRECAWSTLSRRKLFTTGGGFSGIGTIDVLVGDIIVLPFGASMPFVLRQVPGTQHYKLICECYVAGIMYGELMDEYEKGNGVAETFVLE